VNDDFVTRLGWALREAADREERRRAPSRALATARAAIPRVQPSPMLAALVAAAIVLVAGVYATRSLRTDDPAPAGPKVAARVAPAGALDMVVPAFGSAWLVDKDSQTLLRMDTATRRVTARIRLNGSAWITAAEGAMWVGVTQSNDFRLLRIDPRTNRIVARLRIPDEAGQPTFGGPVTVGGNLWVLGAEAAVRIDPASGHVTTAVRTARTGYVMRSFAVAGGDLWVQASDGRLVRLDGATGRREATFRVPDGSFIGDFGMNGLFLVDAVSLARVNPRNLHELWRTTIPSIGPGTAAGGRLWIETPGRRGDRILTLDPRNGHVIDSVDVGEFGAQWLVPVGAEVWMTTAGGHLVIMRR
jgi:streptogramin lyase